MNGDSRGGRPARRCPVVVVGEHPWRESDCAGLIADEAQLDACRQVAEASEPLKLNIVESTLKIES